MVSKAAKGSHVVDPAVLLPVHLGFAPAQILAAAIRLNVFGHIAAGHRTAAAVADAANATQRGIRMLLDAVTSMNLLKKQGNRYQLVPLSRQYLVPSKRDYCGEMLADDTLWRNWTNLTEIIRTGRPAMHVDVQEKAEKFFPMLVRGLHVMNRALAGRVAKAIGAGVRRRGLHVLDVACGSGVWGIAVAEADSRARVTAQDFPGLLDLTRQYARQHKVEKRFDFLSGDLKTVDFGTGRFDVALLGNIVHSEGEVSSRRLFKKLHQSLKPGGRIVIIDMIPNDQRTAPAFPLLFALNMLVNTSCGDTYSLEEYTLWLKEAGFKQVKTVNIGSHSPVIIAAR
ncbi:MAG: methyltransferase [Phycisphaerae bacterium]